MEIAKAPQSKPIKVYREMLKKKEEQEESNEFMIDDGSLKERSKQQILSSIRALKSQISSKGEIVCIDDLQTFVNENLYKESRNQEFFVADALLGNGTKDNPIVITLTSRTCLNFIKEQAESCIPQFAWDATYKVNDLGYPLITTVTQDGEHSIFPTSFSIVSSESEATYTFCLNALKKSYFKLFKKKMPFKYIMSDAANYIFNATQKNCENMKEHLVCFFHLKQAIKKNFAEKKVHKKDRKAILNCVDDMQGSITQVQFDKYYELFKNEYFQYQEFLDYFDTYWVSQQSKTTKWRFFDMEPGIFLTNNICESLNSSLKRDYMNRERKPLHQFLKTLKDIFIDISNENKKLKESPLITTNMKITAAQIEAKKLFIFRKGYYFTHKDCHSKLSLSVIDAFLDGRYTNIADMRANLKIIVVLAFNNVKKEVTCFCKEGYTYNHCLHKMALEIYLGVRERIVLLQPNKRRGRKRRATKALEKELPPVLKKNKRNQRN